MRNPFAKLFPVETVHAHCDVPCGIYDPSAALIAARTVLTMVQKLTALTPPTDGASPDQVFAWENTSTRMVWTKEEHAQICKEQLLILWTDFFKPEHLQMFPNLHETFWKAAKLCSRNKQNVDIQAAEELLQATEQIAQMFNQAKAAAAQPAQMAPAR